MLLSNFNRFKTKSRIPFVHGMTSPLVPFDVKVPKSMSAPLISMESFGIQISMSQLLVMALVVGLVLGIKVGVIFIPPFRCVRKAAVPMGIPASFCIRFC